jgi:hypothetical protein
MKVEVEDQQEEDEIRRKASHMRRGSRIAETHKLTRFPCDSVSFKNTHETAQAIKGMQIVRAIKYLENVREKKEAIPFRRYNGSIGRTGQGTSRTSHQSIQEEQESQNNNRNIAGNNSWIKHIKLILLPSLSEGLWH